MYEEVLDEALKIPAKGKNVGKFHQRLLQLAELILVECLVSFDDEQEMFYCVAKLLLRPCVTVDS